jgi:hypothetical protein
MLFVPPLHRWKFLGRSLETLQVGCHNCYELKLSSPFIPAPPHPLIKSQKAGVTFRGPSQGRCGLRRTRSVAKACDEANAVERSHWQEQALARANLRRGERTPDLVLASGVVAPKGAEAARKGGQDNPRRSC